MCVCMYVPIYLPTHLCTDWMTTTVVEAVVVLVAVQQLPVLSSRPLCQKSLFKVMFEGNRRVQSLVVAFISVVDAPAAVTAVVVAGPVTAATKL